LFDERSIIVRYGVRGDYAGCVRVSVEVDAYRFLSDGVAPAAQETV